MLGELILIEKGRAESVIQEIKPYESRQSVEWKQVNEFHFSKLWSLLDGRFSAEDYESKLKIISSRKGEVWIIIVPDELARLIAERISVDNSALVKEWSRSDEFKWGWEEENVVELLNDLIKFSNSALKEGKSLIYWGSL